MSMPPPNNNNVVETAPRVINNEKLTGEELQAFMNKHGFAIHDFAQTVGVTTQAARLWVSGSRGISVTVSRLVRLFDKYPQLIKEF